MIVPSLDPSWITNSDIGLPKFLEFGIIQPDKKDSLSFQIHSRFGGKGAEYENTIVLKKPTKAEGKLLFHMDENGEIELSWK